MKLNDINLQDKKYDAQRNVECPKCVKIWDYDMIFLDINQCDDIGEYNNHDIIKLLMTKSKGSMNPNEIVKRFNMHS